MASQLRLQPKSRAGGPQRVKVHDENAVKQAAAPVVGGAKRIPVAVKPVATGRTALGEITSKVTQNKNILGRKDGKTIDDASKFKRGRSASVTVTGPQRVPITTANRASLQVNNEQKRTSIFERLVKPQTPIPQESTEEEVFSEEGEQPTTVPPTSDAGMEIDRQLVTEEEDEDDVVTSGVEVPDDAGLPAVADVETEPVWPKVSQAKMEEYSSQVDKIRRSFKDEVDPFDTTMVTEYSEDIFEYMAELEEKTLPMSNYMDTQNELTWEMREKVVDWMCLAHLRYHMTPETLWIAVNIMDRFLSTRQVSVVKLQLVGAIALFVSAKYEEIIAPTVDEFVFITENAYSKEEILKGEKIILQTLEFQISHYCSPYTWVRRISKADDYDLQTRTLSKFLMEFTLLDHRFLNVKPSMIAAIGMYSARRMLGGEWDDAFVFYSGLTEEHLIPGHNFLVEKLSDPEFTQNNMCRKYASKRYMKAALFAIDWCRNAQDSRSESPAP